MPELRDTLRDICFERACEPQNYVVIGKYVPGIGVETVVDHSIEFGIEDPDVVNYLLQQIQEEDIPVPPKYMSVTESMLNDSKCS